MKASFQKAHGIIIVERGEKLVASLTEVLTDNKIHGGLISGLGGLCDVELGFYHLHKKDYDRKLFTEECELISLAGDISLRDGAPYVHVHAALGRADFSTFGGHLFEATVAITAEISVVPFPFSSIRKPCSEIGLALICEFGHSPR